MHCRGRPYQLLPRWAADRYRDKVLVHFFPFGRCAVERELEGELSQVSRVATLEFSEPVVSRIYSAVRLDQPSHPRRHRRSLQSSSWPYPTKGTQCGWRDPPA